MVGTTDKVLSEAVSQFERFNVLVAAVRCWSVHAVNEAVIRRSGAEIRTESARGSRE